MGQLEIYNTLKNINSIPKIENFKIISLLGKGGFSQVKKVKYYNPFIIFKNKKEEENYLAIKQMSKKEIIKLNFMQNIFQERDILLNLYNNNIINMYCTFQDENNIYMVMDYLQGKDLRNLINYNKNRKLKENEIIFISACIISGLEYIHSNDIIHRDIKPENLLFDSKYFLRIGDFGIAVKTSWDYENDNSGTLNYMAPERIGYCQNKNNNYKYSFESDFYSLGVILYELCMGKRPFGSCKKKKEIINMFDETKTIKITSDMYSENLCDLINKLLIFDPLQRIGHNNIEEIKSHPIFDNFPWKHLIYRTMMSPLKTRNNDIILKKKEIYKSNIIENNNIIIENNNIIMENNKNNLIDIDIDEKYQEKFNEYPCIHRLNVSDIMKPKILNYNNIKNIYKISSSLSIDNNNKLIQSQRNSIKNNQKIFLSNDKNNENEKKNILKKNMFRNSSFLPKIHNRKNIKINCNSNYKIHFKNEQRLTLNMTLKKEEKLTNYIYNNERNTFSGTKNNKSQKYKIFNSPFVKNVSKKNIFGDSVKSKLF